MSRHENKDIRDKVLSLIHKGGLTQKEISRIIGISPINLNIKIRRYKEKGYILQKNGTYFLTEKGINVISRHISDSLIVLNNNQSLRKHNVRIRIPLRDRVENPQVFLTSLGISYRMMGLKNVRAGSFNLDKYIVELMPKSCIIIMPDLEVSINTSVEELSAYTWVNLDSVLNHLERKLGLRFLRPSRDFFIGEIVSRHIAFTNNEFAESVKGIISGLWVIEYSELDGKPSLIIDFSNTPELEAIHTQEALKDVDLIKKNLGKLIKEGKSGEFFTHRDAQDKSIYALFEALQHEKQHRVNKNNFKRGFSIGLKAFCLKHKGEKPLNELESEFKELLKPFFFY